MNLFKNFEIQKKKESYDKANSNDGGKLILLACSESGGLLRELNFSQLPGWPVSK